MWCETANCVTPIALIRRSDEVTDLLFDGSLDDMRQLKGLDIAYEYHRFSSSKGDSMNIRVGCKISHSDGSHYLPNCLHFFGYRHDFKGDCL